MVTPFDPATVARCDTRSAAGIVSRSLPDKIESDDAVRIYIRNIDMIQLKQKLMEMHGWSAEEAELAEERYKKWLYLRRVHAGELMPPPEDIDQVWHAHILDTYAYHRDTAAIFGVYFHHFPYFGRRGEADRRKLEQAFENTKKRWREEYGEEPTGELSRFGI
jgi:hypothetical protein